jgi:phosphoribosylformylglycinamidine synthase
MPSVNVVILRAAGTNCDLETQHAWELAGARAERVHLRRLVEQPRRLEQYQIVTIPGGFSYGDDISAGRIFAAQLQRHLAEQLHAFIDAGRLVLGICNGFQILVKAGLLPYPQDDGATPRAGDPQAVCTVTYNEPPGFQNRWVTLRAGDSPCVFTEPDRTYEMPIAHGEGRVVFANHARREQIARARLNALVYVPTPHGEPYNPNRSDADIAGLCDPTGRVLGLMPHPERFVTWTQHPCWTALPEREAGDGLAMFKNAVRYFA